MSYKSNSKRYVDLYRYNQKTKEYKSFRIEISENGDIFLSAISGVAKEDSVRVVLKLTPQELAAIVLGAQKAFNEL